jgi:hypothetical protein
VLVLLAVTAGCATTPPAPHPAPVGSVDAASPATAPQPVIVFTGPVPITVCGTAQAPPIRLDDEVCQAAGAQLPGDATTVVESPNGPVRWWSADPLDPPDADDHTEVGERLDDDYLDYDPHDVDTPPAVVAPRPAAPAATALRPPAPTTTPAPHAAPTSFVPTASPATTAPRPPAPTTSPAPHAAPTSLVPSASPRSQALAPPAAAPAAPPAAAPGAPPAAAPADRTPRRPAAPPRPQ